MTLTPAQCRVARQLLTLSREELGAAVDISPLKLVAFEIGMLALSEPERATIRKAFELAGIEFLDRARSVWLKLDPVT
jgi:hypothetical protein